MSGHSGSANTALGNAAPRQALAADLPAQRAALGQALRCRVPEVVAAVVACWSERRTPSDLPYDEVVAVITQTCSLGTELVGRHLATGNGATPEETKVIADCGKLTMQRGFALTDITKNFFTWRDVTVRVLMEEGERLGLDARVLTEATGLTQFTGDASHVGMVKRFDDERRELHERLDAERAKLQHLALHDPLTGLPNRTLLLDRLTHAMAAPDRGHRPVTVLFLDVDNFKAVNDCFGHRVGDRVLVAVADCLTALVRPSDTVARLGGDEFVILCKDVEGDQAGIDALVEHIRIGVADCRPPLQENAMSVSIGMTTAHAGADPEHVLAQADAAMYATKRNEQTSLGGELAGG